MNGSSHFTTVSGGMKTLADHLLYGDTERCLRYLRELPTNSDPTRSPKVERVHYYWQGRVGLKQAFALKSFLATQDLAHCELWLWLDGQDGYTDHRGRFDYASVSTPEQGMPQRFAILLLSDEYGAQIREAHPPQQ